MVEAPSAGVRGLGATPNALAAANAAALARDEDLVSLEQRREDSVFDVGIVAKLMTGKYRNEWKGVPLMKDPISLHQYLILLQKRAPRTVLDLGTHRGGSALWFADMLAATGGGGLVYSFDLEDASEPCVKEHPRVRCILGDACSPEMDDLYAQLPHPWLIAEDCHVEAESLLDRLGRHMLPGDCIVFEDTHPCTPDEPGMCAEAMDAYRCERFGREKLGRVRSAMLARPEFLVDAATQDYFGPNGSTCVNSIFVRAP